DGRGARERPHGGGVLEPDLGDAVVERTRLAIAGGQGVRLHVSADAGQPGHHLGMLRSPVVLEGLDGELGPAAEIGERLDHGQSSSSTQCRGSTVRKTASPSATGSVATSRITRDRPPQSTWYWVKSPWNTRRRTVAGHTFRAPAGRSRESRTWTVRIESSASGPTRRPKAVSWTMSPAAVSSTTRPSRSRSGRWRPRIRLAE